MGIKEVLSLEDEVSNNVAEQLINPSVLMSIQLPDNYEIVEIVAPNSIVGRTLADIGLREKYNLNLVTLLRKQTDEKHHIMGVPDPKTVIEIADIIIIFGTDKNIDRFIEINK
jgi:trk system potassium uptake protein TrkA